MSEMLERAAKAVVDAGHNPATAYAIARLVVSSIREPTKDVQEAGDDLDDWGVPSDPGAGNASALAHWTEMIDAILRE